MNYTECTTACTLFQSSKSIQKPFLQSYFCCSFIHLCPSNAKEICFVSKYVSFRNYISSNKPFQIKTIISLYIVFQHVGVSHWPKKCFVETRFNWPVSLSVGFDTSKVISKCMNNYLWCNEKYNVLNKLLDC